MEEEKFVSKINKKINDFLYEEEGNISRGKILTVGSLLFAKIVSISYISRWNR